MPSAETTSQGFFQFPVINEVRLRGLFKRNLTEDAIPHAGDDQRQLDCAGYFGSV